MARQSALAYCEKHNFDHSLYVHETFSRVVYSMIFQLQL